MSASNGPDEPSEQSPRKPDLVDIYVGSRIRDRRIALGMSQDRLGEILGVTFQQVQKYERGVNRIAAKRLLDMSRALDVTMAFFFEGLERTVGVNDQPDVSREDIESFAQSPQGRSFMLSYLSIQDPRARKAISDLIDIMGTRPFERRGEDRSTEA